jgi:hypothetical protein
MGLINQLIMLPFHDACPEMEIEGETSFEAFPLWEDDVTSDAQTTDTEAAFEQRVQTITKRGHIKLPNNDDNLSTQGSCSGLAVEVQAAKYMHATDMCTEKPQTITFTGVCEALVRRAIDEAVSRTQEIVMRPNLKKENLHTIEHFDRSETIETKVLCTHQINPKTSKSSVSGTLDGKKLERPNSALNTMNSRQFWDTEVQEIEYDTTRERSTGKDADFEMDQNRKKVERVFPVIAPAYILLVSFAHVYVLCAIQFRSGNVGELRHWLCYAPFM